MATRRRMPCQTIRIDFPLQVRPKSTRLAAKHPAATRSDGNAPIAFHRMDIPDRQAFHKHGVACTRHIPDKSAAWISRATPYKRSSKDDPNLVLLRFDPEHAEVRLTESSLPAGVKVMFGAEPEKDCKDTVADVDPR